MSTPTTISMPRLSDSMEDATIVAWLKKPGEQVQRGEPLFEVETDKTTIVYEAEADGTLVEIIVPEGASAALGSPIAILDADGSVATTHRRRRATPVARTTAANIGLSLTDIEGTGPGGRITRKDVLAGTTGPPSPVGGRDVNGVRRPMSATQKTISRRMIDSRTTIPEFTLTCDVDLSSALMLRAQLNKLDPERRISVNDLVVKAAALSLRAYPKLNASLDGDEIVEHQRVNVGIAVDVADALVVPTIFDADRKSLNEISVASRRAVERARARTLTADEVGGGTFTVSNLGMFGIASFSAVINPPQVAILAVGAISRKPVFRGEAVVAAETAMMSLGCDHRVVYGAEAARFLSRLRELLEAPVALVLA